MLKNQRKNGRKEGGEGGREREIPNLVPHSNDILDSHEAVSMCQVLIYRMTRACSKTMLHNCPHPTRVINTTNPGVTLERKVKVQRDC